MKKNLQAYWWIVLPVFLVVLFFLNLSLGSVHIPLPETIKVLIGKTPSQPVWEQIILEFRLTKALSCLLAGGALALGGLLMQTLFRNPLAGPDVFGLSSGASLAVAVVIMAGGSAAALFAKSFTIALAASIGCGFIFIIILAVAQRVRDNISLLLIGLMIGAVTSSIVSVLQFTSRAEDQQYYLVWTFGSIGSLNWNDLRMLGLAVVIGAAISIRSIKSLNAWLLGDHYATSLGIHVRRSRLLIIIATSILTGAVTAFCGPIGFIGLAVPHVTRLVVDTTNHKILIPAVMIMGGAALLFCDILSHLPGTSFILPINSITALLGAPVVIWIILRNKKIRM